jgi:hypothetical protein
MTLLPDLTRTLLRYAYAGGGTKPPISAASRRANSIVVGSSPSGPMICKATGNPSPVKPIARYHRRETAKEGVNAGATPCLQLGP